MGGELYDLVDLLCQRDERERAIPIENEAVMMVSLGVGRRELYLVIIGRYNL